jgi:hypothetical protein
MLEPSLAKLQLLKRRKTIMYDKPQAPKVVVDELKEDEVLGVPIKIVDGKDHFPVRGEYYKLGGRLFKILSGSPKRGTLHMEEVRK